MLAMDVIGVIIAAGLQVPRDKVQFPQHEQME